MAADEWPTTVDAAVRVLEAMLPDAEKETIAAMPEKDLIMLHMRLGQWVRNNFGLWQDNTMLLRATGKQHPDDASHVIIQALWQRLQNELPKLH